MGHGRSSVAETGTVGGGKPPRHKFWEARCKCGVRFKRIKLDRAFEALDYHIAAAILGRKGGKVKSEKKTEAARKNAKLPRKKR